MEKSPPTIDNRRRLFLSFFPFRGHCGKIHLVCDSQRSNSGWKATNDTYDGENVSFFDRVLTRAISSSDVSMDSFTPQSNEEEEENVSFLFRGLFFLSSPFGTNSKVVSFLSFREKENCEMNPFNRHSSCSRVLLRFSSSYKRKATKTAKYVEQTHISSCRPQWTKVGWLVGSPFSARTRKPVCKVITAFSVYIYTVPLLYAYVGGKRSKPTKGTPPLFDEESRSFNSR